MNSIVRYQKNVRSRKLGTSGMKGYVVLYVRNFECMTAPLPNSWKLNCALVFMTNLHK